MHEGILYRAACPAPAVVMGLLLRPYSLGHDLRLTGLGNPLHNSDTATPRQLSEAVLVCSQGWRETERMPWDFLLRLKLALWRQRCRGLNASAELADFIRYRNEGSLEFPPSGVIDPGRPGGTKVAGAPFVLRLHHFLVMHLRLTEEQAWDYPLGLAKCRWGCYWEEYGDAALYNEMEASADAYARKMDAEAERSMAT